MAGGHVLSPALEAPMPSFDPNPDVILREVARRAAESVPSPSAVLDAGRRGSGRVDVSDFSVAELQLLEARRELQQARARLKHLEQALRVAGRVLSPYLGNGR
jgi:hypothetical protein